MNLDNVLIVKWLSRRPFTAQSSVRVRLGMLKSNFAYFISELS